MSHQRRGPEPRPSTPAPQGPGAITPGMAAPAPGLLHDSDHPWWSKVRPGKGERFSHAASSVEADPPLPGLPPAGPHGRRTGLQTSMAAKRLAWSPALRDGTHAPAAGWLHRSEPQLPPLRNRGTGAHCGGLT